jgi:heme exporter protein D
MSAHVAYVAAAYLASLVGVGGLLLWTVLDGRSARRRLKALEEGGVTRRSAPKSGIQP